MSNFGFFHLRVVNPYDIAFREAKSAVKAGAVMEAAQEFPDVASAVADCTLVIGTTSLGHRELLHPLRRLDAAGRRIRKHAGGGGTVALLFGSEKFGLGNEDLAHCHWLTRIPSREEHGSMNLGQAVAICLYELIRNPQAPAPLPKQPASGEDLERFTVLLNGLLAESGYAHSTSVETKTRRLVRRLRLNAHDAQIWLGMLRQIGWKLGQGPQ